ncbi:unnamed protein product [Ilex paraguariensis]|uniref:Uncharacterized protein n=1 Tax=Ilex paraguariensis TaxID=185542 RepID=A0ABC8TB06_9AQUA
MDITRRLERMKQEICQGGKREAPTRANAGKRALLEEQQELIVRAVALGDRGED